MIRSLPVSVSLATVAVVAAACAVPDTAKTGLRLGDEANGAVVWTTDGREIAATDRIIYADPIQREEYALFEKDGIRAEIVYITTRDIYNKNVALEHWLSFDDMITGFNHVKKGGVELGDGGKGYGHRQRSYHFYTSSGRYDPLILNIIAGAVTSNREYVNACQKESKSLRNSASSGVEGRPRTALRCGKRPNRSMMSRCSMAYFSLSSSPRFSNSSTDFLWSFLSSLCSNGRYRNVRWTGFSS